MQYFIYLFYRRGVFFFSLRAPLASQLASWQRQQLMCRPLFTTFAPGPRPMAQGPRRQDPRIGHRGSGFLAPGILRILGILASVAPSCVRVRTSPRT